MQHLDARDGFQPNGYIHIVMRGLSIIDSQAVEQDESFRERGSQDGQIRLHAIGSALLQIDAGIKLQIIDYRVEEERRFSHSE